VAALATFEGAMLKAILTGRDIFGHHARLALGTARAMDRQQFGVWFHATPGVTRTPKKLTVLNHFVCPIPDGRLKTLA
jgi:hypothetical protein